MYSDTERPLSPAISDDFEVDIWPQQHETAYRVYSTLWDDFYDWEREYCMEALASLSMPSPRLRDLPEPSETMSEYFPTHDDVEYFTVEDFNPRTGRVKISTLAAEPFFVQEEGPYPRYNSCTPGPRNVPVIPDNGHLRIPFIPFADDEEFDIPGYLEDFEDFKWQNDFIDPDLEVIQLETARRLYFTHEFKFPDIDRLGIFKFPMRETSSHGLIWYNCQRDLLAWPPLHAMGIPTLPTSFIVQNATLHQDVSKDIGSFCPNLNCMHTFCRLHGSANPVIVPKATLTNEQIQKDTRPQCSKECYKLMTSGENAWVIDNWDEDDNAQFNSIIKYAPDTLPCDLAVICRKPCYEVYIKRLNTFSDDDINSSSKRDDIGKIKIVFAEDVATDFPIKQAEPCYHAGPCNSHLCECYKAKQRCQKRCRCPNNCGLRFKGCRCHRKSKKSTSCSEFDCPCRKLMRECDPELCRKCDARHGRCSNTQLTKGSSSDVYIKTAKYGLGAFAVRNIKQYACIGEYTGEYYTSSRSDHMIHYYKRGEANYSFDLVAEETVLDAAYLGNETRYLNHSTNNANCAAEVRLVNGDHRIIFLAIKDIKANEELTLNYGDGYWGGKPPPE